MFGSGKKKNAAKKAYEIAYALFRISAKIAEPSVKQKIESYGLDLLLSVNVEEYGNAEKIIAAIDALVKFAVDLNIINIANGDVLLREVAAMNEILIECLDKSDDVDVSKFFSSPQVVDSVMPAKAPSMIPVNATPARFSSAVQAEAVSSRSPIRDSGEIEENSFFGPAPLNVGQRSEKEVQSGNPANILKSGNRQIAILDRIRQSGNCKLREIQEVLPDCSERTIRYDLEELIERNLVERIGSGGPAVSYRIRQIA